VRAGTSGGRLPEAFKAKANVISGVPRRRHRPPGFPLGAYEGLGRAWLPQWLQAHARARKFARNAFLSDARDCDGRAKAS
jgi:hypothetical protein